MRKVIYLTLLISISYSCKKKGIGEDKNVIVVEKREPEHLNEVKLQDSEKVKQAPVSMDTLVVTQADGTTLEVVGKGNRIIAYAETTDGYTVVRNNKNIYEYAVLGEHGELLPSGIKARSEGHRTKFEVKYLQDVKKHIRFEGEKLKELLNKETLKK